MFKEKVFSDMSGVLGFLNSEYISFNDVVSLLYVNGEYILIYYY